MNLDLGKHFFYRMIHHQHAQLTPCVQSPFKFFSHFFSFLHGNTIFVKAYNFIKFQSFRPQLYNFSYVLIQWPSWCIQ